jgi:hypothetical protein
MRALAAAALLLGCGVGTTTPCGLEDDAPDAAQREDAMLRALKDMAVWPIAKTCPALDGWRVHIVPDRDLVDGRFRCPNPPGGLCGGFVNFDVRTMYLTSNRESFEHEIAHVAQYAVMPGVTGHPNWASLVEPAIRLARARK